MSTSRTPADIAADIISCKLGGNEHAQTFGGLLEQVLFEAQLNLDVERTLERNGEKTDAPYFILARSAEYIKHLDDGLTQLAKGNSLTSTQQEVIRNTPTIVELLRQDRLYMAQDALEKNQRADMDLVERLSTDAPTETEIDQDYVKEMESAGMLGTQISKLFTELAQALRIELRPNTRNQEQ